MHTLKHKSEDGQDLVATYDPAKGMNLVHFSKGGNPVIDPKTTELFYERMAGLGALIGPHFHHRPDNEIPPLPDENLFPFIKKILEKGGKEVFSHGIARYVPWHFKGDASSIEASLFSEDRYKGVKLEELEGQTFEMHYKAELKRDGLHIDYSFTKEHPGVIGLHYYYRLEKDRGIILSEVGPNYHSAKGWQPIESSWLESKSNMHFQINPDVDADFGFRPKEEDALENRITLKTDSHSVEINYHCSSEENAFQVYHPKGASYVCIEPVTAKNPREAKLENGHLKVHIKII